MLNRKDIEEWIKSTKDAGYIDCENFDYDEEFNFIISMAEELLKIKEIEFMENTNLENRESKRSNTLNNIEKSDSNKDTFTKKEIESLKALTKFLEENKRAQQDMLLFKTKIQTLNEIFRGYIKEIRNFCQEILDEEKDK